jgi:hypothetical protein
MYQRMVSIGREISTLVQTNVSANLKVEQMKNLSLSLALVQSDVDKVNSHIVTADGEVAFIEEVENLAKADNLGIKIDTVNVAQANDLTPAGLEYLNLSMSVTGSWLSTFHFLSLIENMPYDVMVNQSDISDISDGVTGPTQWQGDFQISVIKQHSPSEQIN